jgi:uracil-DNA glycosylase
MTAEEYFGDWIKVIDKGELTRIMRWLGKVNPSTLCPSKQNIFKAFKLCPLQSCRVIMIAQDPYPQEGVATGLAFGNNTQDDDYLSSSLKVVKESVINYSIPHNNIIFDNSLETWAKQGILLLNSALTCELNNIGSHVRIWFPFMSKLIENISLYDNGYVFMLFGNQAQSFKPFIKGVHKIMEIKHPAYYARRRELMPYSVFTDMNNYLYDKYNLNIELYKETNYGNC